MDFSKKRKAEENGTATAVAAAAAGGGAPTALTLEDARKLLQPLTQEQLLDILQNAVVRHSDVLDAVRAVANRETSLRKLFVRGLGFETTSDSLRSLFATYGDLDEAIVIFDKNTGKSKGYGFVTFKNADGALLALKEPSKKIDGRITVTQFASAGLSGGANGAASGSDVWARKIYVGNVPFHISSERLLSHFMMYGEIEEGPLGFDKNTGKSKGFAFFVYKTEDGAKAALVDPMKSIDGHQVVCKLAADNKKKVGAQTPSGDAVPPPHSSVPGSFQGNQYGPPPPGGLYPGFPGGHHGQGPPSIPAGNYGLNSSVPSSIGGGGGAGISSIGSHVPSSVNAGGGYGSNFGYGPPPAGEFGARLPPSSGGFPDGSQYGMPSSGHPTAQHSQPPPVSRIHPGYQGLQHYY